MEHMRVFILGLGPEHKTICTQHCPDAKKNIAGVLSWLSDHPTDPVVSSCTLDHEAGLIQQTIDTSGNPNEKPHTVFIYPIYCPIFNDGLRVKKE